MTIELPEVKIGGQPLAEDAARLDFAIGLYTGKHASAGQAAKLAGMPKVLFMQEMGKRGICMHYTVEDLEHDIRVARELAAKAIGA